MCTYLIFHAQKGRHVTIPPARVLLISQEVFLLISFFRPLIFFPQALSQTETCWSRGRLLKLGFIVGLFREFKKKRKNVSSSALASFVRWCVFVAVCSVVSRLNTHTHTHIHTHMYIYRERNLWVPWNLLVHSTLSSRKVDFYYHYVQQIKDLSSIML